MSLRLWHPEVHFLFRESLHYFLMSVHPYSAAEFRGSLLKFLTAQRLGGCCYYEVFGAFDVLMRVWLTAGSEDEFPGLLQESISNVRQIVPFRVVDVARYWCRDKQLHRFDPGSLRKITVERVRQVQSGLASADLLAGLCETCLLVEANETKNIKFFVTLSNPVSADIPLQDRIQKDILALLESCEKDGAISNASLYMGYGLAWAIVKAEVSSNSFFKIAPFVQAITEKISGFGVHPTTYIGCDDTPYEKDAISERALTEAGGVDLSVFSLIPELYSGEFPLSDQQRNRIATWIQQHVDPTQLDDEERAIVYRCLLGVISADEEPMYEALQLYFSRLERFLRKHQGAFINARSKGNPAKVYESAGIPKNAQIKMLALGQVLDIFAKAIELTSRSDHEKRLLNDRQELSRLRNLTMHGELDPLERWESSLRILVQFFPKLRQLKEIILNNTTPIGVNDGE